MRITNLLFCIICCFTNAISAQESILYIHEYSIYEHFQHPEKYYQSNRIRGRKAIVIDAMTNDTLFVNNTLYNHLGYPKEEKTYKADTLVAESRYTFDLNNRPNQIEYFTYDKTTALPVWKPKYDVKGNLIKMSIYDSNQVRQTILSFKYDEQNRCLESQNVYNVKDELIFRRKHIYKKDGLLGIVKTTYFPKHLPHKSKYYILYDDNQNMIKRYAKKNGKERISHRNVYNDQNQLIEQWIPKGPPTTKYEATKFILKYDDNGLLTGRLSYEKDVLKQIVHYSYTFYQ